MAIERAKHLESYLDFILEVAGCAPDDFVYLPYFTSKDDQLTLESAFKVLRDRFPMVEKRLRDRAAIPELKRLMNASLAAYRADQDIKGAHLLQDFRDLIIHSLGVRDP